ncbi:MAG: hypothetical protein L3J53_07760 [Proteobacteria bacterium]|nr:hypothetical protein [Pseudomonadota bacterium]
MANIIKKKNIPLIFLISISVFWTYYYKSNIWFNDYGNNKMELWLLIDTFFTLPLLCFYCYWGDKKTALVKSLVYISLLVLLGSYIIPDVQKHLWLYLENARYVLIVVFVLFEIITISTVILAIRFAFEQNQDPDEAIAKPLIKLIGSSFLAAIMQVEARVWAFLLFSKHIKQENFKGNKHFSCHLKDGVQSTLLGFIIITCVELPIVHTLLYFVWSPFAANIISGLTIISLAYFIAQYRAIEKRPISLTDKGVIIRYSLNNPLKIDFNEIESVSINDKVIRRDDKLIKRYNLFGVPNIEIKLKHSTDRAFRTIYLGLDSPSMFIKAIIESKKPSMDSRTSNKN